VTNTRQHERNSDKLCLITFTIDSPSTGRIDDHGRILSDGVRRRKVLFSVSQIGGTLRCELPKRLRTREMIALARDFHVFASRVTTGLLRSILLHSAHRTGTVCARTSWSFDSPFRFRPFWFLLRSHCTAILDVALTHSYVVSFSMPRYFH